MPGGEVADVQRDAGEPRDLRHLPLLEEPIGDPALIEDLDRAGVQTACARAGEVLIGAPLDDGDVDARERQLARQHQPGRTSSSDHHRMHLVPPIWLAAAIMGHTRGLVSSPPVGYKLDVERSVSASFREAVERADLDAAVALLAEDVVFRSPAVFKPYEGRETVATILRTVFGVFEDFRYTDELDGDGVHGLLFEARVGERSLQGIDLLRPDAEGQIAEFTVMIRPASGLIALAERMGPALQAAGVS